MVTGSIRSASIIAGSAASPTTAKMVTVGGVGTPKPVGFTW